MSDMLSEYFKKVRADLDAYAKLKAAAPGSPKGWYRDGYTLGEQHLANGQDSVREDITYFGSYGLQGKREDAALDFCVAAHNLPLEEHLATLLKIAETAPEAKAKACLTQRQAEAATRQMVEQQQ